MFCAGNCCKTLRKLLWISMELVIFFNYFKLKKLIPVIVIAFVNDIRKDKGKVHSFIYFFSRLS